MNKTGQKFSRSGVFDIDESCEGEASRGQHRVLKREPTAQALSV